MTNVGIGFFLAVDAATKASIEVLAHKSLSIKQFLERAMGIEPTTFSLGS